MTDIIGTIARAIDMSIGDTLASTIMADDVLTAIKDAGYVIVPTTPSEAMDKAAHDFLAGDGEGGDAVTGVYRAMIEAGGVKA